MGVLTNQLFVFCEFILVTSLEDHDMNMKRKRKRIEKSKSLILARPSLLTLFPLTIVHGLIMVHRSILKAEAKSDVVTLCTDIRGDYLI